MTTPDTARSAVLMAAAVWATSNAAWVAAGSPAKAANTLKDLVITCRKEAHADLLNAASALIPTDKGNNAK